MLAIPAEKTCLNVTDLARRAAACKFECNVATIAKKGPRRIVLEAELVKTSQAAIDQLNVAVHGKSAKQTKQAVCLKFKLHTSPRSLLSLFESAALCAH
jgi:hypothetical protein